MDEKYIDQVHKLSSDVVVLKEEMINIIKRNHDKDRGKEFESSYTRVIFIMVITYFTLYGYMSLIGTEHAALNAIVPAIGFNISTWTLPYIKEVWVSFKDATRAQPTKNSENIETHDIEIGNM